MIYGIYQHDSTEHSYDEHDTHLIHDLIAFERTFSQMIAFSERMSILRSVLGLGRIYRRLNLGLPTPRRRSYFYD